MCPLKSCGRPRSREDGQVSSQPSSSHSVGEESTHNISLDELSIPNFAIIYLQTL